jgi:hypothetical protein
MFRLTPNRHFLLLLCGIVCLFLLLAFSFISEPSDRYQCEYETISKLVQLEYFVHHTDVSYLLTIKDFGDLLRLMRSKVEPGKDNAPELLFRRDGWGEPFSFERRRGNEATIFVISSHHNDHENNRPVSLTISVTDDNRPTATESWKSHKLK